VWDGYYCIGYVVGSVQYLSPWSIVFWSLLTLVGQLGVASLLAPPSPDPIAWGDALVTEGVLYLGYCGGCSTGEEVLGTKISEGGRSEGEAKRVRNSGIFLSKHHPNPPRAHLPHGDCCVPVEDNIMVLPLYLTPPFPPVDREPLVLVETLRLQVVSTDKVTHG